MQHSVSYIVCSFYFNRLILLRVIQENKSGCFFLNTVYKDCGLKQTITLCLGLLAVGPSRHFSYVAAAASVGYQFIFIA